MILAIGNLRWIEGEGGVRAEFDVERLRGSIARACERAGETGGETASALADAIAAFLGRMNPEAVVSAHDLRRWVDHTLRSVGLERVAAAYMGPWAGARSGDEIFDFEAYGVCAPVRVGRLRAFLEECARLPDETAQAVARNVAAAVRTLSYGRMTAGLVAELVGLESASRGFATDVDPDRLARWLLAGERLESLGRDWATALRDRLGRQDPGLRVHAAGGEAGAEVEVLLECLARRVAGGFELAFFRELSGVLDRIAAAVVRLADEMGDSDPSPAARTIRLRLLGAERCATHVQQSSTARRRRAFAAEVVDFAQAWLERRLCGVPCRVEPLL